MPSLNLLADVGGTNARFALSDGTRLFAIQTLPTADYPTTPSVPICKRRVRRSRRRRLPSPTPSPATTSR